MKESNIKIKIRNIIWELHLKRIHNGINNIEIELNKSKIWWTGVRSDIAFMLKFCSCDFDNKSTKISKDYQTLVAAGTDMLYELDYAHFVPCTETGHKYILVYINHFTKKIYAKSYKTKENQNVRIFLKELIEKGVEIGALYMDNGKDLRSNDMSQLCKDYAIEIIDTVPYQPQAHGLVEAANKKIKRKLRKIMKDMSITAWSLHLSSVIEIINNTIHSTTGFSPNDLEDKITIKNKTFMCYKDEESFYANRLLIIKKVANRTLDIGERKSKNLDKNKIKITYQVNQKVFIAPPIRYRDNQIPSKWQKVGKIVEILNHPNVKLEFGDTGGWYLNLFN
jgi:hypothetical protein